MFWIFLIFWFTQRISFCFIEESQIRLMVISSSSSFTWHANLVRGIAEKAQRKQQKTRPKRIRRYVATNTISHLCKIGKKIVNVNEALDKEF